MIMAVVSAKIKGPNDTIDFYAILCHIITLFYLTEILASISCCLYETKSAEFCIKTKIKILHPLKF